MLADLISLLLLLLFAFRASSQATDFLSIDCGGSGFFTDGNGISWVGDSGYVRTGETQTIRNPAAAARELATLRAFTSPAPRKHCYSIPVPAGAKILVRLRFLYGDYDGLGSPPEFKVQFDADLWNFIATEAEAATSYTRIYAARRNRTDICLARTRPDRAPFVSSVEVRVLREGMYAGVNATRHALLLKSSVGFGLAAAVRYPYDAYDREWTPPAPPEVSAAAIFANDAAAMDASTAPDLPPPRLFLTAAAPALIAGSGGAAPLAIRASDLPAYPTRVYVNMYFTEIAELAGTPYARSFNVFKDGGAGAAAPLTVTGPIAPPFGSVFEFSGVFSASNSSVFTLVPTPTSTLPPVISAMEILYVSGLRSEGTNASDVEVLLRLQERFEVLKDWAGDPCLPEEYGWEWLGCSSGDDASSPRVTDLFLGGYGLSGVLPDFSLLDSLQTIDLHNNSFVGDVPESVGDLPKLRLLNLAGNDFASTPPSLSRNSNIKLNVSGNPSLMKSPPAAARVRPAPISAPRPAISENVKLNKATACNTSMSSLLFLLIAMVV